ncbi:MAG: GYDIA family GHMP kinase [Flavobacteriaceae bacterium]|nr:GYDIA family GHMP kinase [Flavobacteriaceae bacterium]
MKTFFGNGKLLLTSEYAVLDGALALALPTKLGQWLIVEETQSNEFMWFAYTIEGNCWLAKKYSMQQLSSSADGSDMLLGLLQAAKKLQPDFLSGKGYIVKTFLEFPRLWGLGTSSTLIHNLASWANINPYDLLRNTFGGSGYDLACAASDSPILYQLKKGFPVVESLHFDPSFRANLYLVYRNQKQDSRRGIAAYRKEAGNKTVLVDQLTRLTKQIIVADSLELFEGLLRKHEAILSDYMGIPSVQDQLFSDFPGVVKSLGAWGGDFVLVTATSDPSKYFIEKGFSTILSYDRLMA